MKKTEMVIATIAVLAVLMNVIFLTPGTGLVILLTFALLSMLYTYLSFALLNEIPFKAIFKKSSYAGTGALRIIGSIVTGSALGVIVMGMLFKIQSWKGGDMQLGAGLIALSVVVVISLIKFSRNRSAFYFGIFKRSAIYGILGVFFFMLPELGWIELKFRDHPAYIEALKAAYADPENEALWDKVEEVEHVIEDE